MDYMQMSCAMSFPTDPLGGAGIQTHSAKQELDSRSPKKASGMTVWWDDPSQTTASHLSQTGYSLVCEKTSAIIS
jgi:hypothetical protein